MSKTATFLGRTGNKKLSNGLEFYFSICDTFAIVKF
jgi:hypothetical protein